MEPVTDSERLKADMIIRLTKSDAHFKHQQRGEPDLTIEEKSNIALDIFKKNPALFLERFSQFLALEDLDCFKEFRGDYQVDFYIHEISKRCADTNKNIIKNRRYQALQILMEGGEYFSEDEMKWRDPLLFEQMIGQYEDDSVKEEKIEQEVDKSDLRFSTILLKHMDNQTNKQYFELLKEKEEEQEEESDEDSDENSSYSYTEKTKQLGDEKESETTENEKAYLKTEFLRIMQERFLSGEDSDFDYSKVDSNTDYDALDIVNNDAEEKYFDADGELSEDEDIGGDVLLRRKLEDIDLENQQDMDNSEGDDYMQFTPTDDVIVQKSN
ncbi:Coiled-coil domain-containing protein 97 [Bulinus truncatus]|nr:Coiled-coil domain-containing protein 97 [Bulinus truncatus]